jgi:hypothetical protein
MPEPSPPFQLVKGDKYNLTLGVLAAFVLATAKDQAWLPTFWRWQLNAYTNWNLTFLALRVAAGQEQWDPFLLTNSMGVWLGFRTAFCQGLDENMRKKIAGMGLPMPRPLFLLADHLVHTAPPLVLLAALVHRRQRVPKINAVYALGKRLRARSTASPRTCAAVSCLTPSDDDRACARRARAGSALDMVCLPAERAPRRERHLRAAPMEARVGEHSDCARDDAAARRCPHCALQKSHRAMCGAADRAVALRAPRPQPATKVQLRGLLGPCEDGQGGRGTQAGRTRPRPRQQQGRARRERHAARVLGAAAAVERGVTVRLLSNGALLSNRAAPRLSGGRQPAGRRCDAPTSALGCALSEQGPRCGPTPPQPNQKKIHPQQTQSTLPPVPSKATWALETRTIFRQVWPSHAHLVRGESRSTRVPRSRR